MSKCPTCDTQLYSQLFDPRGARLFCPRCGYEEFLKCKFKMYCDRIDVVEVD